MKKTVFKSMLCSILAIFILFSLTSCGEPKMDKIERRLQEIHEDTGVDIDFIEEEDFDNEEIQKRFEVDVEIERFFICNVDGRYADLLEFKTVSDAKKFTKAFRKYSNKVCETTHRPNHAQEVKSERIQELLSGEYNGHLSSIFMCTSTAERRGNIVAIGYMPSVAYIIDNVIE